MPIIIRQTEMEPSWEVEHCKEPGYMRPLKILVGGADFATSQSAVSDYVMVGEMHLPVAQRQFGFHCHTTAEMYIITKGQLTGYDGNGNQHKAGFLDFLYMPPGCYFAVRNSGDESAEFIFVHDRHEPRGAAKYTEKLMPCPKMEIIRFTDLVPYWDARLAKEGGHMRWLATYVGGTNGTNFNPGVSIVSDNIALGLMVLLPHNMQVKHKHGNNQLYVVVRGRVAAMFEEGKEEILEPKDGIYYREGEIHAFRNIADESSYCVWLHEQLTDPSKTVYYD